MNQTLYRADNDQNLNLNYSQTELKTVETAHRSDWPDLRVRDGVSGTQGHEGL